MKQGVRKFGMPRHPRGFNPCSREVVDEERACKKAPPPHHPTPGVLISLWEGKRGGLSLI